MIIKIDDIMKIIKKYLTMLAVACNVIFILWILFNGINEGFKGTLVEVVSYICLMGLLAINSFLLLGRVKDNSK